MGFSLARIEFLADSTFFNRKNWNSTVWIPSTEDLYPRPDTIIVVPNVSRFVFWITEFIIALISTLVSTESFVEFLLTHPCSKSILTLGPYADLFVTPFQTFLSTTLPIKPWIRTSFMYSNGLKKNHLVKDPLQSGIIKIRNWVHIKTCGSWKRRQL